ncbi:MAG: amino acid permease [Caulobacter sp.]|nr:amino acid permease [Caulobacter sp.]
MTVTAPRRMGPVLATLLVAGNMIGSGLFLLPVSLAPFGTSSVLGWIVSTVAALGLAGVFSVLGRLRPAAEGIHDYSRISLGKAAGWSAWFLYWIGCPLGLVAIGLAAVGYLTSLFPVLAGPLPTLLCLIALIWACVLANLFGARWVARIGGSTLILGLIPVLAAIVVGFSVFSPDLFVSAWTPGDRPLGATLPSVVLLAFWGFMGLECANAVAAKVENPARNLPIAALGGVLLAGMVYLLACVAVQGVIPPDQLARSTAPFADIVSRVIGPIAGAAIAVVAILKTFGTLAGWVLVTAESARAGVAAGYAPKLMSESDPAATPRRGIVVTGVITTLLCLATASPTLAQQFNFMIGLTVATVMLVYILCAAALLKDAGVIRDAGRRQAARALAVFAILFSGWVVWTWATTL